MEIVRLSEVPLAEIVEKASRALANGELIVYPTDTLYGIGADALQTAAIERVRELKHRDVKKPLLTIMEDIAMIEQYAVMNDAARMLAEKFLPGALSLILPAKPSVPENLQLDGAIGVRIPNNAFCRALAKAFGKPYISTSANLSGRENVLNVEEALGQFAQAAQTISLIIDAGTLETATPSTVVSCQTDIPFIVREGALSREALGL